MVLASLYSWGPEFLQVCQDSGCVLVPELVSSPSIRSAAPDDQAFVVLPSVLPVPPNFHLPIGYVWSPAIGLDGFLQSLQFILGHAETDIGEWLQQPYVHACMVYCCGLSHPTTHDPMGLLW